MPIYSLVTIVNVSNFNTTCLTSISGIPTTPTYSSNSQAQVSSWPHGGNHYCQVGAHSSWPPQAGAAVSGVLQSAKTLAVELRADDYWEPDSLGQTPSSVLLQADDGEELASQAAIFWRERLS